MQLINATGVNSKLGRIVKQHSKQRNSFVYVSADEKANVFVVTEGGVISGASCYVQHTGDVLVFVRGEIKKGDTVRSRRGWDTNDQGACFKAESSDIPYISIGVALQDGRNELIEVALNIHYERLVEDAWDDLRAPANGINPAGSTAPPTVNTADGSLTFSTNKAICAWFQLPHSWHEGTDLRPHLHWSKSSTNAGTVNWQMKYKWANIGGVMPAFSSLVSGTVQESDSNTIDKHAKLDFPDIDGTGKTVSSMLCVYLIRTAAGDTYADNANFYELDIHYKIDSFGSRQEYIK